MRDFRNVLTALGSALGVGTLALVAFLLLGAHLNTSGRCPAYATCEIGDSATTQAIQLVTDGTGTSEVVLPAGAIDGTEVLDDSIVPADLDSADFGDFTCSSGTCGLDAGAVDFAAQGVITTGAAPAATCTAGQIHVDTDETDDTNCTTTADNSLCLCTAADTWTALENN